MFQYIDFEFDDSDGLDEDISGCTDPNADNYNPDATINDGSCTYSPLGELTFGVIDYNNGTLEINLDCQYAVSEFTFDVSGINITGYYGGTTEQTNFDINIEGSTVSGNSILENIPANSGLLIVLTFDAYTEEEICFSNSNITTYVGIEYEAILDDCLFIEDTDGCVGEFDCLGECGGSAIFDECGVCDGDNLSCADCAGTPNGDAVLDCAGVCEGGAELDECGVCNGDGICSINMNIDLIAGWNWISFNVVPEDNSLDAVLASVSGSAIFIASQSSGISSNYGVYGWQGSLGELDPTEMYKIDMAEDATLTITGAPVDVASTPISLSSGWNWLGYLPQNPGGLDDALASVSESAIFIASQSSGISNNYGVYGWQGSLSTLEPGSGYLLNMDAPGVLVYPAFDLAREDLASNKQEVALSSAISDWDFSYSDYEFIGTITASIESRDDAMGDVVGVFVDGECRGIAERTEFPLEDDSYYYIIQVYSNDLSGEELSFKYYDSTSGEVIEYTESIAFENNMVIGDGFDTYGLSRESRSVQPEAYVLGEAYPNPFNPVTSFEYTMPEAGMVEVLVYDVSGRMVAELAGGYKSAGTYSVTWNANDLSSGVYMLQMIAGDFVTMQKVMLIK